MTPSALRFFRMQGRGVERTKAVEVAYTGAIPSVGPGRPNFGAHASEGV